MKPNKLLKFLNKTENTFGRNRKNEKKYGPRTIDLNILLFGSTKINSKRLVILHPKMYERAFVLIPLYDINKTARVKNMLKKLPKNELKKVKKWHH